MFQARAPNVVAVAVAVQKTRATVQNRRAHTMANASSAFLRRISLRQWSAKIAQLAGGEIFPFVARIGSCSDPQVLVLRSSSL